MLTSNVPSLSIFSVEEDHPGPKGLGLLAMVHKGKGWGAPLPLHCSFKVSLTRIEAS